MTQTELINEVLTIVKANSSLITEALETIDQQAAHISNREELEDLRNVEVATLRAEVNRLVELVYSDNDSSLQTRVGRIEGSLEQLHLQLNSCMNRNHSGHQEATKEEPKTTVTVKIALITAIASIITQVLERVFK